MENEGEVGLCCRCFRCCKFLCRTLQRILSIIFSQVGLIALLSGYCVLGGFIFEELESKNELEVKDSIKGRKERVTNDIWEITEKTDVFIEEEWIEKVERRMKNFELELISVMKKEGWNGNESHADVQWTFPGSLFFAIISITTIGYGDQTPKTLWGKVVAVLYVIVGMPLLLLCLGNTGKFMAQSFRFIYWRLCCFLCINSRSSQKSPRRRLVRERSQRSQRSQRRSLMMPRRTHSVRSQVSSMYGSPTRMSPTTRRRRSLRQTRNTWFSGSIYTLAQEEFPAPASPAATAGGPGSADAADEMSAPPPHTASSAEMRRNDTSDRLDENFDSTLAGIERSDAKRDSRKSERSFKSLQLTIPLDKHSSGESSTSSPTVTPTPFRTRPPPPLMHQPISLGGSFRSARPMEEDFLDYPQSDIEYPPDENIWEKEVPIWLCSFVVFGYVCVGSVLFHNWEGWNYLDSSYFCIVSLTTIGFGDFVPKTKKDNAEASIAICSAYLLFGMSLVVMTFNLVQERVVTKVRRIANVLGVVTDEELEEME